MSRSKNLSTTNNEPDWNVENVSLVKGLNWYHHFNDVTDSKKYTLTYMKTLGIPKTYIEAISNLPEYHFTTIGFACRMKERGAPLTEQNIKWISDKIDELKTLCVKKLPTPDDGNKINIQERVKNKAEEYLGELEDIIDNLILCRAFEFDTYQWMIQNEIKGPYLKYFIKTFEKNLAEIEEAILGEDKQLTEAYSNFNKNDLKKYAELLKNILEDIQRISHKAKITKKPKKKKAKSIINLVNKLVYKKEDLEYKITSISPTEIIGAKQLWIFNTKTRKLGVYHSMDIDGLIVRGTTIFNFNETISKQKILRTPLDILPEIIKGTRTTLKKTMEDIDTIESDLTGRINSDIILLRAFK